MQHMENNKTLDFIVFHVLENNKIHQGLIRAQDINSVEAVWDYH